jgi:hypothetical protein
VPAWLYKFLPAYFKWAGMAAFASHHVRLALFPFRLDRDRTGYVDIPRSLSRQRALLTADVNPIRETDNAIFNDIFWAHLAYATAEDGIGCLRGFLGRDPHYATALAGFEAIDQGRRVLEDPTAPVAARRTAEDRIWEGKRPPARARAACLGATQPRSPLVRVRPALLDRLGADVRGAGDARGSDVLHLVLPLLADTWGSRRRCRRRRG